MTDYRRFIEIKKAAPKAAFLIEDDDTDVLEFLFRCDLYKHILIFPIKFFEPGSINFSAI